MSTATLDAIAAASPNTRHVAGAAAAIVIVMDGDKPEIETFDEGRVAERILVAATALGLASAIGWIRSTGAAAVGELLGTPEGKRVRTSSRWATRPRRAPGRSPPRARRGDRSRRWCASSGSPEGCSAAASSTAPPAKWPPWRLHIATILASLRPDRLTWVAYPSAWLLAAVWPEAVILRR